MGGVHICEILQNGFWASLIYRQPIPFIQVFIQIIHFEHQAPEEKKRSHLLAPHARELL